MSDFRTITSKFDTKCSESAKPIKVGERCIFNIVTKKVFSMESETGKKAWADYKASKELPF